MNIRKQGLGLLVAVIFAVSCVPTPARAVSVKGFLGWSAALATSALAGYTLYEVRQKKGNRAQGLVSRTDDMLGKKMGENTLMALNGLAAEVAEYLGEDKQAAIEASMYNGCLQAGIFSFKDQSVELAKYVNGSSQTTAQSLKDRKALLEKKSYWDMAAWLKPSYAQLCGAYAELYLRSKVLEVHAPKKEASEANRIFGTSITPSK